MTKLVLVRVCMIARALACVRMSVKGKQMLVRTRHVTNLVTAASVAEGDTVVAL